LVLHPIEAENLVEKEGKCDEAYPCKCFPPLRCLEFGSGVRELSEDDG
jgi:hypothetical protein